MINNDKKPIELWLTLGSVAVGIFYFWSEKTSINLIVSLFIIFILLIPIVWKLWWIEKSRGRQISAALLFVAILCVYGYSAWPTPVIERPEFELGRNMIVKTQEIDSDILRSSRPDLLPKNIHGKVKGMKLSLCFYNIGKKAAHNLKFKAGFAPVASLKDFIKLNTISAVNPVKPNGQMDVCREDLDVFLFPMKEGKDINVSKVVLYISLDYADAEEGGRKYQEEWFLGAEIGKKDILSASVEERDSLLPVIRSAYSDGK